MAINGRVVPILSQGRRIAEGYLMNKRKIRERDGQRLRLLPPAISYVGNEPIERDDVWTQSHREGGEGVVLRNSRTGQSLYLPPDQLHHYMEPTTTDGSYDGFLEVQARIDITGSTAIIYPILSGAAARWSMQLMPPLALRLLAILERINPEIRSALLAGIHTVRVMVAPINQGKLAGLQSDSRLSQLVNWTPTGSAIMGGMGNRIGPGYLYDVLDGYGSNGFEFQFATGASGVALILTEAGVIRFSHGPSAG